MKRKFQLVVSMSTVALMVLLVPNLASAALTLNSTTILSDVGLNLTAAAASTHVLPASTASALQVTDGTNSFLTVDTSTTTSGASALSVVAGTAPTIASASGAEYTTLTVTPPTITLTGTTAVTSTMDSIRFSQPTITDASAVTVSNAATVTIAGAPIPAGSATITQASGLKIEAGAVASGATRAYGLFVDSPTSGTANYAALFNTGNVGIGVAAPAGPLDVRNTTTSTSTYYGTLIVPTDNASGTLSDRAGLLLSMSVTNNTAKTITNVNTLSVSVNDSGDNTTITNYRAGNFSTGIAFGMSTVAITNMVGLETLLTIGSGSSLTVTNGYGLKVKGPTFGAGTITNNYGVHIEDQTNTGSGTITNNWNLYSAGSTTRNYFGGSVAIGVTSTTSNSKLEVKDGHYASTQTTAPTSSVTGTGYSGSSMVSGSTDTKGGITATVGAAAGTLVVTFNAAYATAPICTASPATATGQVDVIKMYVTSSTSVLTLNFVATPTGGSETWNYICVQ